MSPTASTHPETRWQVPTTAAGVAAGRDVEGAFRTFRIPVPDNILVDNTNGASRLVLHVNGHQRPVAPGGTVEVRQREVGRIAAYVIIPDVAITAGDVQVYERRIGNGGAA